jgi:hypothetical protein
MRSAQLPDLYDGWTQPSYALRVRGTVYLWGSAGIKDDVKFPKPLLLHIRNDEFGEPVTLGTEAAGESQTVLGVLEPGQVLSIPMQSLTGVFATCELESTVACLIRNST